MERAEWLKEMRRKAEILYNHGIEGFGTDAEAARHRDETSP